MDPVYLNGAFIPRSEAMIPVEDRGFLFADGLYEVTPFYGGRPLRMDGHLRRLTRGLGALRIDFDVEPLPAIHQELLERCGLQDHTMSMVYLQITRGVAPRSHAFPDPPARPTVFAYAKAFERPAVERWMRGFNAVTVPDRRWTRCDLKTIQLLPSVLAQEEARQAGATDALMVRDGLALEGAHNNVFAVFGDVVATHPASNQILPGITREVVLEVARARGVPVEERTIPVAELACASEIFFTGTTTEIRPTVELDGQPVGEGRVGPVTLDLMRGFRELIARECGVELDRDASGSDGG
ncbi:MAG: D-amino acid aminotransferase [Gemmatimonadales bacterium]|nr:MAG: D-amino acid aminotransferase [Gemmatimonadales bacterium]